MRIRKTVATDLVAIGRIYENAKAFMRAAGNPNQWNEGKPNAETAREDSLTRVELASLKTLFSAPFDGCALAVC